MQPFIASMKFSVAWYLSISVYYVPLKIICFAEVHVTGCGGMFFGVTFVGCQLLKHLRLYVLQNASIT
jgi:hypothetical protein